MMLHPVIEQHNLHRLAVGSAVLLKIPREQFTPLRRVIAFYNECTIDGTVLRTKIGPDGIEDCTPETHEERWRAVWECLGWNPDTAREQYMERRAAQ